MSSQAERLADMAKDMPGVLVLDNWESSATCYPEMEDGSVRIKKVRYRAGMYEMYGVLGYKYYILKYPAQITTLQEKKKGKWETWMIDDPPHFEAMQQYARNAIGSVLVAGLGLGMLVEALEKNPMVTDIVVVEINPDVISLIKKLVKTEKTFFVHDDFYKYLGSYSKRYDVVICDIWTANGLKEVRQLISDEVMPLNARLKEQFPNAELIYHGFGKIE